VWTASCGILATPGFSELRSRSGRLEERAPPAFDRTMETEELQRTRYAMFEEPPSYEELAARFKVSYRELAELRSMKSSWRK
jgi:hypothetical protein